MASAEHFHHLVFEVTDLERTERFYVDGLGMRLVGRDLWPEDEPNACFEVDEGQYLVAVQVPEVERERTPAYTGFFLDPDRWIRIREQLARMGGLSKDDPKAGLRAVGELKVRVKDPDGYILELTAHQPPVYEMPPACRGKVDAGRIEDFAIGSMTRVPEGKFFLLRTAEGFLALSEVCSHQQFTVTYQPEHHRFYCPLHRYRFTRTGKVIERVAPLDVQPLHHYAIEYVDGHVVVDTDVSLARSPDEVERVTPLPNGRDDGPYIQIFGRPLRSDGHAT